jgi:nitrite reductase/ring-hydroxylating ferredoxin subunit
VPVVYTQRFDQLETVRAEVNGYAMAIARVGDQYYAVQDHCTHRYGPLSEGRLCADGEVECPWHRSRFDLKTGQPTHGPAQEPLKTFETRVVDGIVQVRVPAEPPSHEQGEQKPAKRQHQPGAEQARA